MNQILALREKRAKAWEAAKAFLESKRGTDGLLSAEDTATYDRMEADVVNLGKEIERLERQAAIDAELNKPTSHPITNQPGKGNGGEEKTGRASAVYKTAFWNAMRKKNYLDIQNALQVGTDSEGGYLVPDEYERTLVEALEEENFFRSLATVIQTSSGDRKIPIVASKGEAKWIDEEAAYPESDDSFGQISISAYKVATMIKVSDELLNDNVFNLEAYISKEFGRRIGTKEEEAFFTGDGKGKPTGIFNATGGASLSAKQHGNLNTLEKDIMDQDSKLEDMSGKVEEIQSSKMYRTELLVEGVNIFKDRGQKSTIRCRVYSWDKEITDTLDASAFCWHRNSGNEETDADWDRLHAGRKSIVITTEDVQDNASFYCEIKI